jgi:Fe-S oxidoreductase
MKDRLKAYEREIEYCSYCPKMCRFACPVAKVTCSEASTPTGKMTLLKLARDGAMEFDSELAELMYQCSGCLLSRTYCEHNIEVIGAFEAARAVAVEKGFAPERVMAFGAAWGKFGNPYGNNLVSKLERLAQGRHFEKKPVLVFAGCTMTHYFPETVKDLFAVLDKLGLDFEVFKENHVCCGYPLFATGHWQVFEEHKKWLTEKISGYDTILSPCPTCAYFLKTFYLKPGLVNAGKIQHITEFIAEKIDRVKLQSKVAEKVVYHDPCHLGRYLGVYEAPRKLLQKVCADGFTEFAEHGDQAGCCGGGGGLPLAHPGIARGISRGKLSEFKELGGQVLATACPMCERMFTRTGREQGMVVKDLVSLLAQNMA